MHLIFRFNMIRFNYVVIDTETTGLDPYYNGITQIAAIDNTGRTFLQNVIPFNGCVYSEKAMDLTGKSALELSMSEPNESESALAFKEWLTRAPKQWIFVGANPCFDFTFLYQLSIRTNVKMPIGRRKFDIQGLALALWSQQKLKLKEFNGTPMLNVNDLAAIFGIKREGNTHDALEDVKLEKEIMEKLFKL
jgi:DNA polymerase III epsilon subunit-like protein